MQDVGIVRPSIRSEPVDLRQRVHWHAVLVVGGHSGGVTV